MKKIFLIVILVITAVSCELFSPKEWAAYNKRRAERGVRCYREESGYVYWKTNMEIAISIKF